MSLNDFSPISYFKRSAVSYLIGQRDFVWEIMLLDRKFFFT